MEKNPFSKWIVRQIISRVLKVEGHAKLYSVNFKQKKTLIIFKDAVKMQKYCNLFSP